MSIVRMKKLRLIAVRSQQEEILRELMLLGCVEIRQPNAEAAPGAAMRRTGGGDLARYRSEQTRLTNALRQLDRYAPEKKGLLTPRPEVSLEALLDESALADDLAAAGRILELDEQVRRVAADESREWAAIESLKPWESLDMALNKQGTERCVIRLGTLPAAIPFEAAVEALGEGAEEAQLCQVEEDLHTRYLLLLALRESEEAALAALRPLGWSVANVGNLPGTAQENIAAGMKRLEALAAEKEGCVTELVALGEKRSAMQLGVDTLATRIARADNAERLMDTESTFTFEGWLTAPDEEKLAAVLAKYDCAWETEETDPEHPEEVPVKLSNNEFTDPFNMVTEMYSLPAYNGLDPNPWVAPFFALFFGIMFADMAYGLMLLAAGLIFKYVAKPKGGMKRMAGLLIIGGISTFIIGFLTGGFFGDVVAQIGKWFGQEWSIVPHLFTIRLGEIAIDMPLNLLDGNNPLYMLIFAIVLGAIHLAVGVGLGMYLKIKDGEYIDALLNDLCWWVMIIGLLLMVMGKGPIVLYVGIGMMVLGTFLTNKGIGKITGLFGAVYNGATGYLGDFLSYSRLMALMLAGSVIASVFNQLASLGNANGMTVVGTILFVVVFFIGHALNFALNLIGCFVHTLRLQFLEFFGKWYRDGGKPFRPLNIQTKYVDIKEE